MAARPIRIDTAPDEFGGLPVAQQGSAAAPDEFGGVPVDPADVTINYDPRAIEKLERSPGIPLYQVAPGKPQKELPPIGAIGPYTGDAALGRQIQSGYYGGLAGVDRLGANLSGLLDTAATKISGLTGLDKGGLFKHIEEWAREQQKYREDQAAEYAGGRRDFPSQVIRGAAGAVTSLPITMAATALGGPTLGMAGLGALETADQGPGNMLKGAVEGAAMGKFLHVMGPYGRPIRIPAVAGVEYAKNIAQGVDSETALANALNMGALTGVGGPGTKKVSELLPDVAPNWARQRFFGNTLNPVQQQAVDYLHSQDVPLTGFQLTGNRFLAGVEATTAHKPLGAQLAREFHAGTQEAMAGLSGKLAEEVHPESVTPYEAGKAAGGALDQHIAELAGKENDAYATAWQHAGKPEFNKRVVVKTTTEPLLDEAGEPTGERQVPVYKDVNMPVDVRWLKEKARNEIQDYELLPAATQSQSAVHSIYKTLLKMDDNITASRAEKMLQGFKAEAGYNTDPSLRNESQGAAAGVISRLQKAIDAAVAETGQDSVAGLQAGRQLHARKMEIADLSKKLRDEPVEAFNQLSRRHDAGVDFLKEIAKRAPDAMPQIGRAYLDNLFDQATREGGWMRADGVFRQWDSLGDQTKALLFPKAGQVQALDRFFLASKITSERINTSGTALTKAAEDAGVNVLKWLKGHYLAKVLFTPKGIQFLTGIAQNPPTTPSQTAAMKAQAARVFGPSGKPPEEPPEGQPPTGGGPPSTPPTPPGGGGGAAPAEEGTAAKAEQPAGGGLYDQLQQAGEEAKQRLKKGFSGGQLYSMFPGDKAIDLATLAAAGVTKGAKSLANRAINDMGEWGAARIANGAVTFPEWKKQMLDDAMDVHPQAVEFLRRNARAVYQAAQQTWKDRQGETLNGKITDIEKILQYAEAGKEGTYWYKNVKPQLEPIFGPNTDLFLNFLAATSPRTPVADNVVRALQAYSEHLSGKPFSTEFEAHLQNLQRAAKGEPLSGLKVGSFGPNLLGDFIKVTVDTWMGQAYGFKGGISNPQYRFLDYAISQAAKAKGIQPAEMQAAIWTGIKKLEGDPRLTAEPFETVVKQYLKENPDLAQQIDKAMRGAKKK